MGWAAVKGTLGWPAIMLYLGGVFWTLGYDTIYAHQDKADDSLIGVKSTALRLGAKSKEWIAGFYTLALSAWLMAGALNHSGIMYLVGITGVTAHFFYQVQSVKFDNAESCMKVFRSNTLLGWILFAAIIADKLFRLV
jgi:4-hydroxybenzoate polyprenyltransferase